MTDSTDRTFFERSLRSLQRHIEEDYAHCSDSCIVALSRKGPRLLERLFGERLAQYRVVTEYALPYLFKQYAKRPEKQYQIMIVDDAIYFGSTLNGVYNEILAYKDLYKIDLQVKAYTAIKSETAPTIEGLDIVCDYLVAPGYSHYFAKNVMAYMRGLHTSMEVDYPRICYTMSKDIDFVELYTQLQSYYPQKVYQVKNKENASVNILLNPVQGSFFNKMRIYVDGHHVHVVTMTPRVITDSDKELAHLFDQADGDLSYLWSVLAHQDMESIKEYPFEVQRSVKKVIVAIADYLYSFNTFLGERRLLEDALKAQAGDILKKTIRNEDLEYLLGNQILSESFCEILNDYIQSKKEKFIEYRINLIKFSDKEVFESYNFPDKDERDRLSVHNMHMIRNSKSLTQALSAIFFNQTLLIERWSRKKELCNSERLRFGYTFQSISALLKQYGRFEQSSDDFIKIHAWIDQRIDQGCIVPQYIIDGSRGIWTRVFRPGENEDVVLSHLSRWVISIYNYVKGKTEQVNKTLFYNILAYVKHQVENISEELEIPLRVEKRGNRYELMFTDDSGVIMDLLDYMEKMYILKDQEGFYAISNLLQDNDIREHTTLSKEVMKEQQSVLDKVIQEINRLQVPSGLSFLIFNFLFRDMLKTTDFERIVQRSGEMVLKILDELEPQIIRKEKDLTISQDDMLKMMLEFSGLYSYLMHIMYVEGDDLTTSGSDNDRHLLKLEKKAYRLNIAITVIQLVYYLKDIKRLSQNIANQQYYHLLEADKVRDVAARMIEKENMNEAYKDRSLLFAIRGLVNNHVLND